MTDSTTPTEGVKLEPLKGELYIYAIRAHRARYGSDLKGAKQAVDAGWRLSSADKPEPLVSGPQAAKRIQELNASLNEAMELLFAERARALKAERQRDEAVGALEIYADRRSWDWNGRVWVWNGAGSASYTGDPSQGFHQFPAQEHVDRECGSTARSVLTSIREG